MAVGSSFAAMNTMYAAVARRATRNRHSARAGIFARQHSAQLSASNRCCSRCSAACSAACWCCRSTTSPPGSAALSPSARSHSISASAPRSWLAGVVFALVMGAVRRTVPGQNGRQERKSWSRCGRFRRWTANSKVFRSTGQTKRPRRASPWAVRWIIAGVAAVRLAGRGPLHLRQAQLPPPKWKSCAFTLPLRWRPGGGGNVILNATGYIVAAHKIELAAKVVGKVAWIGVEKADKVKAGQELVRLEDDEYRAHVLESQGQSRNAEGQAGGSRAWFAARRNRQSQSGSRAGPRRSGECPRHAGAHARPGASKRCSSTAGPGRCAGPLRRRGRQSRFARSRLRAGPARAAHRKRSTHCARRWSRPRARSTTRRCSSKTP